MYKLACIIKAYLNLVASPWEIAFWSPFTGDETEAQRDTQDLA